MSDAEASGAILAEKLTKRFGSLVALDRLNLEVEPGEAVTLFGPNGAGKTTLIRILTLGLKASSGAFRIAGLDPRRNDLRIRQRIGVISHQSYLYDALTPRLNLEFFARIYGVRSAGERAAELLQLIGLEHRADDPVSSLSRGMQQRVSLARALVHEPEIVFLDEPFTGLDPQAARTLCVTLEELRRQGRTVLLVTHNLSQGLELSDRWLLLSRGRIVDHGRSSDTDRADLERRFFAQLDRGPAATGAA